MNPTLEGLGAAGSPLHRAILAPQERALKLIEFPGPRGVDANGARIPVGLWSLFKNERDTARLEAVRYLSETLKVTEMHLVQIDGLGAEEAQLQTLLLALRDPNEPRRPFAANAGELRMLHPDELKALHDQYELFVEERSVVRHFESAEEVDAFLAAVGKGSMTESSLRDFGIGSLCYALRIAAVRCASWMRPSFLPSSPSSDSSTSTSPAPTPGE